MEGNYLLSLEPQGNYDNDLAMYFASPPDCIGCISCSFLYGSRELVNRLASQFNESTYHIASSRFPCWTCRSSFRVFLQYLRSDEKKRNQIISKKMIYCHSNHKEIMTFIWQCTLQACQIVSGVFCIHSFTVVKNF
jgi:hypothetical protein